MGGPSTSERFQKAPGAEVKSKSFEDDGQVLTDNELFMNVSGMYKIDVCVGGVNDVGCIHEIAHNNYMNYLCEYVNECQVVGNQRITTFTHAHTHTHSYIYVSRCKL